VSARVQWSGMAMAASVVALGVTPIVAQGSSGTPVYSISQVNKGGFEPRISIAPDGTRWVSTQDPNGTGALDLLGAGTEVVYSSKNGGVSWTRTPTDPQNVTNPCCDNEMAVSPTGRIFTSVIDFTTININIQYSDDGGQTWHTSAGNTAADQDREWLAVGTKDPVTGMNDVYMLWHNLASGAAQHAMMVSTSRDNGATFGAPVPITLPGSEAYLDLQCADSGGPSNIFTNPSNGWVYAVFGTRSKALAGVNGGGCAASATQAFEINIVAATKVWVSVSKDQGLTWTNSRAVDDSVGGNIVGMQVNAGALDNQGNVYLVYPESPQAYPNYDGASVRYTWAPPDLSSWSKPVTVAPSGGAGHILTHLAAGDPGKVSFFYLAGVNPSGSGAPAWYPTIAQTYDGQSASPHFVEQRVSNTPAWTGTATTLMGVCNPFPSAVGPVNGAANGLACPRSSDVLGQAIDAQCNPTFTWDNNGDPTANPSVGTWVVRQTDGPSLCGALTAVTPEAGLSALVLAAGAAGVATALYARRRRRHPTI